MSRIAPLFLFLVLTARPFHAQSDAPRFEVVSIKPNANPGVVGIDGARTLRALGAGFSLWVGARAKGGALRQTSRHQGSFPVGAAASRIRSPSSAGAYS